jgi:hypothetical protein
VLSAKNSIIKIAKTGDDDNFMEANKNLLNALFLKGTQSTGCFINFSPLLCKFIFKENIDVNFWKRLDNFASVDFIKCRTPRKT